MSEGSWRRRVRTQVDAFNADRRAVGIRHATVHRIRHLLDMGPVTTGRVDLMTGEISDLVHRVDGLEDTRRTAVGLTTSPFERVWTTTQWMEQLDLVDGPLVSVVMPTRGERPTLLAWAVASVLAQSYPRWELLVVADRVDPATLDLSDDPRIRVLESNGAGVSAARNTGLDAANGELVAYCDDDNTMGRQWLRAVVHAAGADAEVQVWYGARLIEDGRTADTDPPSEPTLSLPPFNRALLMRANYIDMGVLAHRRTAPGARFDDSLDMLVDWDLVVRLTARTEPRVIPVIASNYHTGAPGRISEGPEKAATMARLRTRFRAERPLRVLAYNAMFPLLTETYIADEVEALARSGAEVAFCTEGKRSAPMPVEAPLFTDLDEAVSRFGPDVVLVHWATFAGTARPALEARGVPYAVRAHSFDFSPDLVREHLDAPGCIGVWAYPHLAATVPGVRPLPSLFTAHEALVPPAAERDLVLSVSAGLPKKDWDVLLGAFEALPGVDRRIVIGTTYLHESLPSELVLRLQEQPDPPLLQVNLTRDQVFELFARTAVLVYTLEPGQAFGNPNSIIEGLCAGACVVAPNREEARRMIGSGFRGYDSADDIVAHVREVLAGGPAVDEERARNVDHGLANFADPMLGKQFATEFNEALTSWLARQR